MDSDWLEVIDWIPKWCVGVQDPRQIPPPTLQSIANSGPAAALCSLYMAYVFPNQELQQAAPLMQSVLVQLIAN